MIKVGIVGGTGYTGVELLRLLLAHPKAHLEVITSRTLSGELVSRVFPSLIGQTNLSFSTADIENLRTCDVVFFATPHGVAMNMVPALIDSGVRIIDLGADFRIRDVRTWQSYYQIKHSAAHLLEMAVYGLTEHYREEIKTAKLVANPGCYPTAIALALKPLLSHKGVDVKNIIADCKSGVSGAGRTVNLTNSLCEVSESIKAYGISGHRHLPEINQTLTDLASKKIAITFIPHLVPMIRGMLASIYVDILPSINVVELFTQAYEGEHFVKILPEGISPETRFVKLSNLCHIGMERQENGKWIILSAIDNLLKGASGQAVQNMNIMFGFDETEGLPLAGLIP